MENKFGTEIRAFNCLYKEVDEIYHEIALKMGMSDSGFIILYALAELGDGCLQKDIVGMYYISKQTVNSSISNLKRNGYVYLRPGKGRDMHICLTSKGEELLREKIVPVIEAENSAFDAMTQKESSELIRLTRKYAALLREKAEQIM